jgi:cytochrome c peroxidase
MKTIIVFVVLWLTWSAAIAPVVPLARAAEEDEEGGGSVAMEESAEAAVELGERLFLETRFAQFFAAHSAGPNDELSAGDPVLDFTITPTDELPGPFAGRAMNCRACHLVDEHRFTAGGGNRTYADFARRSPVPAREDGHSVTPRNSPTLVGIVVPRSHGHLLHFDGEFPTPADLVVGTLTGRNYGWLPGEEDQAVDHIARVLREDDGTGALARAFGGAYRRVLGGGLAVPEELRLPPRLQVDVDRASDRELVRLVGKLIAAYLQSLQFAQEGGVFDGSPFDLFLEANGLRRAPRAGQSDLAYSREIRARLARGKPIRFIRADGPRTFALHDQPFRFGPKELHGLRIFLAEGRHRGRSGGVGNCVSCHPLPRFTDFRFHNTGATQRAYDGAHGSGTFAALAIPDLATRNAAPAAWLPASPQHPDATGRFRQPVDAGTPGAADLGLWNVLANPDMPRTAHQRRLARAACRSMGKAACRAARRDPARLLDASIALFKTPGLRDLGHSAPYFHDGSFDSLEAVVTFYRETAALARSGALRNAAPELARLSIDAADVAPLAAFLRALNEDYE